MSEVYYYIGVFVFWFAAGFVAVEVFHYFVDRHWKSHPMDRVLYAYWAFTRGMHRNVPRDEQIAIIRAYLAQLEAAETSNKGQP